jgi:hypothetical protein
MTGTIGYDDLRADTIRQVAKLMAAAAITAPKSGGQRPATHRYPAGRHSRRSPPARRKEPPGTPAADPPNPALT